MTPEMLIEQLSYLGVVLILLIAGFGMPLPEDIPLIASGILCGLGKANIYIMLPVAFGAVVGADVLIFTIGRLHGERLRRLPMIRKYLSDERLAKASEAFHDHVGKTLFTARFMPGLRTPLFFTAGSVGVKYWRLLLYDGLAALISVPALVLVGFFGANNKDVVFEQAKQWQMIIFGGLALLIGGYLLMMWIRHQRAKAGDS
jgi:membrane protein DedA with SNARE-associated domain